MKNMWIAATPTHIVFFPATEDGHAWAIQARKNTPILKGARVKNVIQAYPSTVRFGYIYDRATSEEIEAVAPLVAAGPPRFKGGLMSQADPTVSKYLFRRLPKGRWIQVGAAIHKTLDKGASFDDETRAALEYIYTNLAICLHGSALEKVLAERPDMPVLTACEFVAMFTTLKGRNDG